MATARKRAFFIDLSYTVRKGKTYISLLLKGKRTTKLYYQYDPYLYVDAPKGKKEELLKARGVKKSGEVVTPIRVEEVERGIGLEKKKLFKLYCKEPSHVPAIRAAIPYPCYEYNIPFTRRFIFDMQLCPFSVIAYEREGKVIKRFLSIKPGNPKLSMLSFDIETYNPVGAPREGKDPVIMVSYCCDKTKGVLTFKNSGKTFVETLQNEKEVLNKFSEIIEKEDPDILLGYNSANFDLPYLKARAQHLGTVLRLGKFSSKNPIHEVKKGLITGMRISGRVHFDIYPVVKFFGVLGLIKTQRFTLDAVAEDVLGKKKVKIKKEDIWQTWDRGDIDNLCEYSMVDAELAFALGERFLPLEMELSSVAKMPLFETTLSTSGQLVENLLMYHATERGEIIPSKPGGDAIMERINAPIQGAFVKLPEPGIYENIAVLDFRGLYPSIIVSYNIDPGTLVETTNIKNKQGHEGEAHKKSDFFVSPTSATFSKKETGLVPYVLDYLVDMRMKIKKELKKFRPENDEYTRLAARSQALKILANSIAGDEPLILKDPSGKIRIIKASHFIDPRISGSEEHITETQLGDATGWKVASFKNNQILFKNINKVMRHGTRKLLKVRLKSGREVKVTEDHSMFSLDRSCNAIPVSAKHLDVGTPIIVPKQIQSKQQLQHSLAVQSTDQISVHISETHTRINLIQALLNAPPEETADIMLTIRFGQEAKCLSTQSQILTELEDCGSGSPTELGKSLGFEYRTISHRLHELQASAFVTSPMRQYPPFDFHITKRGKGYARFLHAILPHIRYNQNARVHFVMFNEVREHLPQVKPEFFEKFLLGPINGTKIPSILTVDSRLARLLGYYVSEGYSRKWQNQTGGLSYRSEVTNYNQKILFDMEQCFNCLGVTVERKKTTVGSHTKMAYLIFKYVFGCGSNAYEKTVPEIILNSDGQLKSDFLHAYYLGDGTYASKQKMYKFTTVSRDLANSLCFLLLQLGIGDFNLTRDSKFYRVHVWEDIPSIGLNQSKVRNRHFNHSIPGNLISEEISALGKQEYYYAKSKRMSEAKLRDFRRYYLAKFGKSQKLENLSVILDGDLSLDYVVSIESLKTEEYVYDLSVEDTENFIGGLGCVCLHNSFYGYLGYARSRWYSRPCAESVTAWGRKHINDTIEAAEKKGFVVLYGDTDSVFILYKNKQSVLNFMEEVNRSLPEKMELELEGFYPRGVFVSKKGAEERGAKKKYALLGEDGRIKIRGFELVRRDWSAIAKETQLKVLEAILKEGSKEKAVKIIRDVVSQLQEGKVPLEKLAISTQLNKDPGKYEVTSPELSAAKKMLKAGIPAERGTVIFYVVGKNGKSISEKAEPLELANDYDAEYYINNQVLPAVMKIMKELGYDEYSMKFGGKQKSLDSWF